MWVRFLYSCPMPMNIISNFMQDFSCCMILFQRQTSWLGRCFTWSKNEIDFANYWKAQKKHKFCGMSSAEYTIPHIIVWGFLLVGSHLAHLSWICFWPVPCAGHPTCNFDPCNLPETVSVVKVNNAACGIISEFKSWSCPYIQPHFLPHCPHVCALAPLPYSPRPIFFWFFICYPSNHSQFCF